ncbi:tyrosine-protein phosphatase non-receptor type 12-like isoform X2 [Bolinopsis microptera]|uniref:tyrosine-protein phosphatase non-receptor type 12-like isoform X2 n=1 Tax=Bolinopsis microptera TaxID=2820187 RepID=UPI00307994CE
MEDIISYREILEHVQKQFKEDYVTSDKYKLEFDQLKAHSDALNVTQSREDGWLQYNRCKNRYKDILPYDKTRVRLPVINNIAGSDYINASHISGPDGYVNYIAAQGPLPGTVFDFWRMVWYNHSTVIVMVCKEVEMGKHKCANYWGRGPGESLKKGNFSVTLVSEQMKESYIVRKLVLTCADVSREVYQYQYLNWPDRDVPTDGEPLNKMLAIVRDKCPAKTTSESPGSPIVIHCSAGCGRTGTVLAIDFIDILIRNQRLDRNFSLFELVKRMRTERVAICQTKQQFGFVYYTAIQLLDSAIQMLNIRSEAISECIYENVPHSPTLAQEDGILVQLDSDPPPKTGPQTKPPPPPSTQPLTTTDEKLLKPSKPLKPERPRSTVGKPTDNKAETGESVNLIVQEGAANTTAAVSGDVSCGDVSCGDAVTEEPVYASVNPFAKTGKILDLDSPTDESDDETDPVQSLTTTVLDTHLVSDPRSKPSTMESCPPLLTPSSAPPPLTPSSAPPLLTPSSVPPPLAPYSAPPLLTPSSATPPLTRSPPTATPHIITPAVRSPLVKIRSAPPSSPTPSRQPPSSPSPLRSSLPPPSNNSTFLNSTLCSGHLIYSSSLSSFLPLAIGETSCYEEIQIFGPPSTDNSKKNETSSSTASSKSCDSLLDLSFSAADVVKTPTDCLTPSPILRSYSSSSSKPPESRPDSLLDLDDLLNLNPSALRAKPKPVKRDRQKKVSLPKPTSEGPDHKRPKVPPPPLPTKRKSFSDPLEETREAPKKPERPKGLIFPKTVLEGSVVMSGENPYSDITIHTVSTSPTIESSYSDVEIQDLLDTQLTVPYEDVELLIDHPATQRERPPTPEPFSCCAERVAALLIIQRTQNQLSTQDDDLAYSQVFGQTNRLSSPRFDDDNYSELSIPRSDVTDSHMNTSSGDEGDEEDEDHYETFDSVVKASISKEKLEKTNSRTPSTGKKSKTKGFGFKGLLANISDNAHTASQNLKSKSQNMNIKSLTGNNNAATHQDLPNMKYESEFGKRTGSPAGPRDMPSHWIKI